jgi:hypothetical protein
MPTIRPRRALRSPMMSPVTSLGHVTSTFTIGSSRIGILAGYLATDIKVTLYDVMLFAQVLSRLRE